MESQYGMFQSTTRTRWLLLTFWVSSSRSKSQGCERNQEFWSSSLALSLSLSPSLPPLCPHPFLKFLHFETSRPVSTEMSATEYVFWSPSALGLQTLLHPILTEDLSNDSRSYCTLLSPSTVCTHIKPLTLKTTPWWTLSLSSFYRLIKLNQRAQGLHAWKC